MALLIKDKLIFDLIILHSYVFLYFSNLSHIFSACVDEEALTLNHHKTLPNLNNGLRQVSHIL